MFSPHVDCYAAPTAAADCLAVQWRAVATPAQIRAAEQPLLARLGVGLMRQAAFALASQVLVWARQWRPAGVSGARVAVLAGAGGNGGDALFAAAQLARRGALVEYFTVGRVHEEAEAALRRSGRARAEDDVERMRGADIIIDGLLGIGAQGQPRPEVARLVAAARRAADAGARVVAVDLPSGLDPVTGQGEVYVPADLTVTFGALKPVHLLARRACGEVLVCGVGIDEQLLPLSDEQAAAGQPGWPVARLVCGGQWPLPGPNSHKYTGGVTGLYAGSERYPGAGVLAAAGAVRATSPMVRYFGAAGPQVAAAYPSVVVGPGRVDSVVIGPGYPLDEQQLVELLRAHAESPVVLDAEALRVLGTSASAKEEIRRRRDASVATLLTPHDGEYEALMGCRPGADRWQAAVRAAQQLGAWVLLKGAVTWISDGREVFVVPAPTSLAATPGSGDVLAGVLGALVAHTPSLQAAALGAYVHAQATAGLRAPVDAHQLAGLLPEAIAALAPPR